MSQQSKSYPMPDPAAVAAKVAAAGGPQICPTECTGSAHADGVTLTWVIANGQITITVKSKPFFVSYDTIWEHADSLFA